MKWKWLSVFSALLIVLVGCQMGDNNAERGTNNPNIDPTTSRNNTGDGMLNDRNHMMERDADRYQNRDNVNMNNRGDRDNSNYEIAEEAAEKITDEIDEIDRAYVLTTNNNAYVAANLDTDDDNNNNRRQNNDNNRDGTNDNNNDANANDLTDEVKDEIARIVQSVDRDIDNVYVSTNPDFLNLANDYADDVERGEPIEGFFDQFGSMIERLFPENRR